MNERIALFGTGLLGSAIASRFLATGRSLLAWNRTLNRTLGLKKAGAEITPSPVKAAEQAVLWVSVLSDGAATRCLWSSENGLAAAARPGVTWLQMATLDYESTIELAGQAQAAGISYIDCPVLGSVQEAQSGQLILMAGGNPESVDTVRPVLDLLGSHVVYCGPHGAGTLMKHAANLLLAQTMAGMAEWFNFGIQTGLQPHALWDVIRHSKMVSDMLISKFPRLVHEDYQPSFPLKWMRKDLHAILESAHIFGAHVPLCSNLHTLYNAAHAMGFGDEDYSVVSVLFRMLSRGQPQVLHNSEEDSA